MMIYRSGGLRIAQFWFDEPSAGVKADIIRYRQALVPAPGARSSPYVTMTVDLERSEEALFAQVNSTTRYEINRARKRDAVECHAWDGHDQDVLGRFRKMYDVFARQKGLSPLPWREVKLWAEARLLDLSWATQGSGDELVFHAYVNAARRARFVYGTSLYRLSEDTHFRSLVGRANRLLHWDDMLRFKAQGVRKCDFGGWYEGSTDPALLRINDFKQCFGGQLETNYDTEQLMTLRARLAVLVRPLVARFRPPPSS